MSEDYLLTALPAEYRGLLIIMRGVPGSGKSYDANKYAEDPAKVFSTDDYFDQLEGGYRANWAVDKLFTAHRWNQHRVRAAMQRGVSPVVVDNTNLTAREAEPYVYMARMYQYLPEVRESISPWWKEIAEFLKDKENKQDQLTEWAIKLTDGFEFEGRTIQNTHGVPYEAFLRMFQRYRPWTIEDVESRLDRSTT